MHAASHIIAMTLVALAHAAGAMGVADILSMTREEASRRPDGIVTGVITYVAAWQQNSFVAADPDDVDGPGMYVAGDLPGRAKAKVLGAGRLEVGDVVEIAGSVSPLMLEPGFVADSVRVVSRMEMPPPPERRLADLMTGRFNNRRCAVKGVLRNVGVKAGAEPTTEMLLGMSDGTLTVHLRGEWRELAASRDAEVVVDGVCISSHNARAEFLRPEFCALSREAIHIVPQRFPVPFVSRSSERPTGVMAWTPDAADGHLRRLRGEVTFVSGRERYFVLQDAVPVRVNVAGAALPAVGDEVEADGFPEMSDDSGVLDAGSFRRLGTPAVRKTPSVIPAATVDGIIECGYSGEYDCHYRLCKITGRAVSAEVLADGSTEVSISVGKARISARLEAESPRIVAMTRDGPLVTVTGVLKVRLESDAKMGHVLQLRGFTVLLRDESDVQVDFDGAARRRQLARLAKAAGLLSLLPLAVLAAFAWLRSARQRERSAAVAGERRRMAEELHDTIAQHLSGARLLLYSVQAESKSLSEASRQALSMAGDVLESARREVRDAVMNLKSESEMSKPLDELLRAVAARASAKGAVRVRTLFRGIPRDLPAQAKTDLLAIVQEAMTNALKHGKARRIVIVSDPRGSRRFSLSVLNDGAKFDASRALGPETGHFGLSGMRERAARNGFSLSFGERGGWTEVRMERSES